MASHLSTRLKIDPPLLNSASPWATTFEDLKALYDSPFTGAVTVRTSVLHGFHHDDRVHQYAFFDGGSAANVTGDASIGAGRTSLNTLGYSPIPLDEYLGIVEEVVVVSSSGGARKKKPIILSVTGSPEDVEEAYLMVGRARAGAWAGNGAAAAGDGGGGDGGLEMGVEVNLSCPNIKGKPPPAYDRAALAEYLVLIQAQKKKMLGEEFAAPPAAGGGGGGVLMAPPVGIKLPPYTCMGQFEEVVGAMASATVGGRSVVDFVTATNTLGSCLLLNGECQAVLASEAGTGIGGLAGAALHPLALGNVATLRRVLDQKEETKDVMVIGVGGVYDHSGFERMRKVGAGAVGVATALGREGVGVFEKILKGEESGYLSKKEDLRALNGQSYVA